MATTVRVRDEDKTALDALQAKMTLATGKRVPLDEVVSRLVELAEAHEDELLLVDEAPPLTPTEIRAFLAGTSDWGSATNEDDIDRVLYGGADGE